MTIETGLWIEKQKSLVDFANDRNAGNYDNIIEEYNAYLKKEYTLEPEESYNVWVDGHGMIDARIPNALKRLITIKYDRLVYSPLPKPGEPKKEYVLQDKKGTTKTISLWTEIFTNISATPQYKAVKLKSPWAITYMLIKEDWKLPVPVCICKTEPYKTDSGELLYHKKSQKPYYEWHPGDTDSIPVVGAYYYSRDYDEARSIHDYFCTHITNNAIISKQVRSSLGAGNYRYNLDTFFAQKKDFGLLDTLKKEKALALKAFDKAIIEESKQAKYPSVEEYIAMLQQPALLRKEKIEEMKQVDFAAKEMQYMPELLLTISSLKDEIEATHEFFNNQDNKMSFKNIESRLGRLKDMSRILKSIRKDNK